MSVPIRPVLISSWRDREYLFSLLAGMAVSIVGLPPTGAHLYTWTSGKRHCESKTLCLAGEHSTMTPARAQTQIAWSGVQHNNHYDKTTPLQEHLMCVHDKHL